MVVRVAGQPRGSPGYTRKADFSWGSAGPPAPAPPLADRTPKPTARKGGEDGRIRGSRTAKVARRQAPGADSPESAPGTATKDGDDREKAEYEQNLESKEAGPTVPTFEDDDDEDIF